MTVPSSAFFFSSLPLSTDTYLRTVDLLQRLDILLDHILGQLRGPQTDYFDGLAMMRATGHCSLDALAEVVLDSVQDNRRVVDGVDLCSCQGLRVLQIPVPVVRDAFL